MCSLNQESVTAMLRLKISIVKGKWEILDALHLIACFELPACDQKTNSPSVCFSVTAAFEKELQAYLEESCKWVLNVKHEWWKLFHKKLPFFFYRFWDLLPFSKWIILTKVMTSRRRLVFGISTLATFFRQLTFCSGFEYIQSSFKFSNSLFLPPSLAH